MADSPTQFPWESGRAGGLETIPAHHIASKQDWTWCLTLRPFSKHRLVFTEISISLTPCPSLQGSGSAGEGGSPHSTDPATPDEPREGWGALSTMGHSSVCVQTLFFLLKGLWRGLLAWVSPEEFWDSSAVWKRVCMWKFRLMCGAQIAWQVRNNSGTIFVDKHWCNNSDSYPDPWKLLLLAFIVGLWCNTVFPEEVEI